MNIRKTMNLERLKHENKRIIAKEQVSKLKD